MNVFKTDAHKLEAFHDSKNRLWVNDSKGTNIDATIEALKRYKNKEILIILGGDDKGVKLNPLFEALKSLHVSIFAIGTNTDKITKFAQEIDKKVTPCYQLTKAVELIKKVHTTSSVALLSPAASSLDQFSSYAQRGDMFKELALQN
jgi:UDP-N-acetylmuramoylalanine--D-glutamate ligase